MNASLLRAFLLVLCAASTSFAEIAFDSDGERRDLGVFPFSIEHGNSSDLFVQVSRDKVDQLKLTSVAVRYSYDGGQSHHLLRMRYVPKEHVWRAYLGKFSVESTPVTYYILAEDEVSQKIYKDDYNGSPFEFPYQHTVPNAPKPKELAIVETRVVPSDDDDTLQRGITVELQVQNSEQALGGFVRYTVDSWHSHTDAALVLSKTNGRWEALIGPFDANTEVQFAAVVKDKEGNEIWDNNNGKNFKFKTGVHGFLPGDEEIAKQKERLASMPVRKISGQTLEYLKRHKIYISMTTSPERLSQIHHVIETLDLENVEKVIVTLPMAFKNDPKQVYSERLMKALQNRIGTKLMFLRTPVDLGPLTKIVPALEEIRKTDPKAIVTSIDDDTGYAKGMVLELAAAVIHNPNSVAGGSAQDLEYWGIPRFGFKELISKPFDRHCDWNQTYSLCDVVEGFGAIAYRPEDIDTNLLRELSQLPGLDGKKSCRLSDDLVINFGLALRGVSRYRVNNRFYGLSMVHQFAYGMGADALHKGAGMSSVENPVNANEQKYRQCYKDMVSEVLNLESLAIEGDLLHQDKTQKRPHSPGPVEYNGVEKRVKPNAETVNFYPSAEEKIFVEKLRESAKANQINVCYSLESAAYFLVHLLPLYHVNPGLFCGVKGSRNATELKRILLERGYPETSFRMFDTEQDVLQWFGQSPKNLFLADTGYKDSGNREWEKTTPNYINFPHGVDEDAAYIDDKHLDPSVPSAEMTLLLTKYNEAAQGSLEKIRNYYHLDPNKKTIFYAGTIGQWEFSDSLAPAAVREQTLQQLVELKKHYNVIVRPHPLQSKEFMDGLRREFVVAPFLDFPSFNAIYDLSDVVIGSVSTATTTATRRPELPIVLLRPRVTWPGRPQTDMAKYAARYKGIVLGQETAIVVDDAQILQKDSLLHAVEHALQDTPENRQRIEARKRYFAYWFDCVDGYEEYRAWARTLEKVGINIAELKSIYATFPKYRDRPLCHF